MHRWPPIVWLAVLVGSLFIVHGSVGGIRPPSLIVGGALLVAAFLVSIYLALRPGAGPMRPLLVWSIVGLFALYVAFAAAAALAGGDYAAVALLAGTVPLTALNLWVGAVRGTPEDSPYPSIDLDDSTPLGTTPEHSDADEHDDVLGAEASVRPTPRFRRLQR
jgi:hypothetical protein